MSAQESGNKFISHEISLVTYVDILLRRKLVFLIPVLFSIIMAFLIAKNAPVIFEQTSVVRIGSFSRPLMTVPYAVWFIRNQTVLAKIIEKHKLSSDINELKSMFNAGQIKITGIDDRFLKITVESAILEKSRSIANALAIDFVDRGNEIFSKKKKFLESQLRVCQESESIKSNPFVYQVSLNNMLLINEELLNSEEFEVVEFPSSSGSRRSMQNTRIMIVLMSGVFLGIVFAFSQEFWVNNINIKAK